MSDSEVHPQPPPHAASWSWNHQDERDSTAAGSTSSAQRPPHTQQRFVSPFLSNTPASATTPTNTSTVRQTTLASIHGGGGMMTHTREDSIDSIHSGSSDGEPRHEAMLPVNNTQTQQQQQQSQPLPQQQQAAAQHHPHHPPHQSYHYTFAPAHSASSSASATPTHYSQHDLIQSNSASSSGAPTPRNSKSPIGTKLPLTSSTSEHNLRRLSGSHAGAPGIAGLKSMDNYGSNNIIPNTNRHGLTLSHTEEEDENDDLIGAAPMEKEDYHPSPFINAASITVSPLSTPSYSSLSHQLSPTSPGDSYHHNSHLASRYSVSSMHSSSNAPSRGEESFEALEKSLTDMIFHNSHPPHSANTHSGSSTGSSSGIGSAALTRVNSLSHQSKPPSSAGSSVPSSGNIGSVQSTPGLHTNSPPGSVAYIVLPNGQVQTVDMVTIQQALQPSMNKSGGGGGGGSGGGGSGISPTHPPQIRHMHNLPPSSASAAAAQVQNMQATGQIPQRIQPSHAQQQQQGGSNINTPAPQYSSYAASPLHHDLYPIDSNTDDNLSFSLETLSTKTLPLFSPPTPPLPHPNARSGSASNFYNSHAILPSQTPPPSTLSHRPPHSHSQSHSAYSSPATMSLQQRAMMRQQNVRASSGTAPYLHDYQISPTAPLIPTSVSTPSTPGYMLPTPPSAGFTQQAGAVPPPQQQQQPGGAPIPSITPLNSSFYAHLHNSSENLITQAKSQAGSRLLQTKLQANDTVFFTSVFDEVYEALPELMVDLFGNYLCQKLILFANDTQRLQLLLKILPELLEISCDRQGTRAIQKLIENLKHNHERQMVLEWLSLPLQAPLQNANTAIVAQQQQLQQQQQQQAQGQGQGQDNNTLLPSLPSSPPHKSHSPLTSPMQQPSTTTSNDPSFPLMPRLIHLIRDQNGSHVVHSILDTFPASMLYHIQRNAMQQCRSLGVDQHGLCVLKKCLTMVPPTEFIGFTKYILEHLVEYVNNQYGNYLIQHIIERTNGLYHAIAAAGGEQQAVSNANNGINMVSSSVPTMSVPAAANVGGGAPSAVVLAPDTDLDALRTKLHGVNDTIYRTLRGSFSRLSRQKFSSNVVEKLLKIPDAHIRAAIIAELIEPESIAALLQCSYGNYVLVNILYVASQDECGLLLSRIRPEHVLSGLRKNIRGKWERILSNAHLIHPGLVVNMQGEICTPHTEYSPSGSPHAVYPSPQAVQLITSILGSSSVPGGDYTSPAANERGLAASPTIHSPSMRSTSGSAGVSPSFSSRQFRSQQQQSSQPNSGTLGPIVSSSNSGNVGGMQSNNPPFYPPKMPHSARGSLSGATTPNVSSPHFNANLSGSGSLTNPGSGNFRPPMSYNQSNNSQVSSSANSPSLHYRGINNSTPGPSGYSSGQQINTNFPVTINSSTPVMSPMSPSGAGGSGDYPHPTHPRAPQTPTQHQYHPNTSYQQARDSFSNQQQHQQRDPQQKYANNPQSYQSAQAPQGTTESIQQQIQNTQNQLRALMDMQREAQHHQQGSHSQHGTPQHQGYSQQPPHQQHHQQISQQQQQQQQQQQYQQHPSSHQQQHSQQSHHSSHPPHSNW